MYDLRLTATIWPASKQRAGELGSLVLSVGHSLLNGDSRDPIPPADYLLVDLSSVSDDDSQYLSKIADYLDSNSAQALIWTDMERLDALYAKLPLDQCHFLLDGDADAVPILMGMLQPDRSNRVHEGKRDAQFGALHKISDDLADFARTLARIAEQDRTENSVNDRPTSFRPAPASAFQPFSTAESDEVNAAAIREMIKLRRMRDRFFGQELFADPAWDILLDLLAAQIEGKPVSVSSLCIAAAVPATTALRWIGAMTESGMLTREHDTDDARRIFIGLSLDTEQRLRQYFADLGRKTKPI